MRERSEADKREILNEARKRFRRGTDWEAMSRSRFKDDIKFAEADAYNQYQWPAMALSARAKRPILTINRVRQHNLDILNDARQSRVAIKVRPLRGGASYEAAEVLDGVIRHIEYISNADTAYQNALKFAVQGGIGWIRLVTDYAGDDTFDQEIFIRPVKDPLTILLDPDITEFDGSDAKFGFVFTDMPKDEFDKAYPKFKDIAGDNELAPGDSWVMGEHVRIAEYFRAVQDESKMYAFEDPQTGQQVVKTEAEIDKELLAQVIDNPATAYRSVVLTKIEHFKIIGDTIAEEKEWLGKYVPLIRCVGEETIIDGQLDRKGHTRALLDSQRMFNYNASAAVEFGALQSKTPWVAPVAAIEEVQEIWNTANTDNPSVLPFKHRDEEGNEIPAPKRIEPPAVAPVFMQGMRDAIEQMYLASGQNQADFGQPGNERSGKALEARQRQGDNATYHYLDHQALMIRLCGKQVLDLLPKVYDTKRMVKYRDDAGKETDVQIDPEAPQPFQKQAADPTSKDPDQVVLNPKMGIYDVQADVGPAYATRRQEAFAAFSQLLGQNKELISVVGDIWMRFADIPGGEEAAERLKRMVPKQAMMDGPSPDLVEAQQKIEAMGKMLADLTAKLEDKGQIHQYESEKNAIKAYDSVTGRVKALEKALALDPGGLLVLVKEVIEEAQAQSAGGNAETHALETPPGLDGIHPGMGGQLQDPVPHPAPAVPAEA